jgi:peptide/nickel transport system permease protein
VKARELLAALWGGGIGRAGLVLLGILLLASLYVVATYPPNYGTARWGNPALWADNPKAAPPVWSNWLTSSRQAPHRVLTRSRPTQVTESDGRVESVYDMPFRYQADAPPTLLSMSVGEVVFQARPPLISVLLLRPDGGEILLHREVPAAPRRGEQAPYSRYGEEPLRVVLGGEDRVADGLLALFADRYGVEVERDEVGRSAEAALFGVPAPGGGFQPLHGEYRLQVRVLAADARDRVSLVRGVIGGSVYGLMGTDSLGRDLAEGLLFGLPVALLIGIATSLVSTLLGMSLGLVSGYAGGATDVLIQRGADIVANVPVLPLLIFLVFIGGSQLWLILLVLVAFSWPGLTIVVRSMVLQLRTGQEVEAARALGASVPRIIFRHVFPHTASYILAQLVFFAPSAILAEAGLSFLGLGDPSLPTWGQILEQGFRTGAVFLGYWWWVIPPGLAIVVTAVTFMFLALGMEPVVDPRLKGRRSWRF